MLFDKTGVGLSEPVPQVRTLDDRAAEIEAVVDVAGFGIAVLWGVNEGGPVATVFAATRPERTRALILTGTFSYFGFDGSDDMDRGPAERRARLVPLVIHARDEVFRVQEGWYLADHILARSLEVDGNHHVPATVDEPFRA